MFPPATTATVGAAEGALLPAHPLGRSWATTGPQLGRSWATTGPQLGRNWATTGPQLADTAQRSQAAISVTLRQH